MIQTEGKADWAREPHSVPCFEVNLRKTDNNMEMPYPIIDVPCTDAEVFSPKDNSSDNKAQVFYPLTDLPDIPSLNNPDKSQQPETQEWDAEPDVVLMAETATQNELCE